jgi:SAM-dependent methyltransferase
MSGGPRLYGDLVQLWPLVSPPEDYAEEVATFRARLLRHGVADGAALLHLGCGGGSIDFHLKRDYRVTGVDLSEGMLQHARRLNPEVEYVHGDMRDWRAERVFDAVLVHDAISYMMSTAELEAAYRTAAAHLRPGGVLLALPEELRERLAAHRGSIETHATDGRTVTLVELVHDADPSDAVYELVYLFVIRDGDRLEVEVDRHVHGVFELGDFLAAIDAAGFDAWAEPWELPWEPDEVPLPIITGVLRGG